MGEVGGQSRSSGAVGECADHGGVSSAPHVAVLTDTAERACAAVCPCCWGEVGVATEGGGEQAGAAPPPTTRRGRGDLATLFALATAAYV